MPALNFLPLPRVSHPKPPSQTDGLPTLPGPCHAPHHDISAKDPLIIDLDATLVRAHSTGIGTSC
jgi:hypothetical protein